MTCHSQKNPGEIISGYYKTGFLHYIYECGGCPEEERKAQKVIKFTEVVDENRLNVRKNLVDDFLKSGGY